MNWRAIDYRILVAAGVLGFLSITLLYAVEITYFNRYFSFSKLLLFGLGFGLILGAAGAWHLSKQILDSYDRMRLRIGLIIGGALFGPLLFSLLNRHLDPWPSHLESVELVGVEDRISSRFGAANADEVPEANSFHIYFYRNTVLTRIIFDKKPDLGPVQKGDQIGLKVRKGLFGIEWVQSIQNRQEGPAFSSIVTSLRPLQLE